eukprot:4830068-Pleurochrysis_carterae.AAC.1
MDPDEGNTRILNESRETKYTRILARMRSHLGSALWNQNALRKRNGSSQSKSIESERMLSQTEVGEQQHSRIARVRAFYSSSTMSGCRRGGMLRDDMDQGGEGQQQEQMAGAMMRIGTATGSERRRRGQKQLSVCREERI